MKKFNVEPSLPRIARVDDRFKARVRVVCFADVDEFVLIVV